MSRRTIYKCDRCGKEQDSPDQMWLVGFVVTSDLYRSTYRVFDPDFNHRREWCRACVEEFDLVPRVQTKPLPVGEPQKTLEDLIREIVREEVEQNAEALRQVQS